MQFYWSWTLYTQLKGRTVWCWFWIKVDVILSTRFCFGWLVRIQQPKKALLYYHRKGCSCCWKLDSKRPLQHGLRQNAICGELWSTCIWFRSAQSFIEGRSLPRASISKDPWAPPRFPVYSLCEMMRPNYRSQLYWQIDAAFDISSIEATRNRTI